MMEISLEIGAVFTALVALAGAGFALYQYHWAQRWKMLEFAASQLERLSQDPILDFALTCLDWEKGPINLPERLSHFADIREDGSLALRHDRERLIAAFQSEDSIDERVIYVYRIAFDRLFDYFEQIEEFIRLGVIQAKDVRGLKFWINRIDNFSGAEHEGESIFRSYLKSNGYEEMLALMDQFKEDKETYQLHKLSARERFRCIKNGIIGTERRVV